MAASEESKGGGDAHKGLSASSSTGGGEEEREREIMERESRIEAAAAAAAEDVEEGEILDDDEEGDEAGGGGRSPATPLEPLPLENSWTFWFDSHSAKSKQSAWGTSLRSVHTFSTVQDFWSLYNNIRPPSKLESGADLYCFKCKIEPKWEDPICANGGKWTIICPRGRVDTTWLYTLLALIGEQFDCGDEICGAVVNVRKQDRISLWTKNATNEAAQTSIGKQWKELVDCNDTIGFIVHDEAKRLERNAKNRYSV